MKHSEQGFTVIELVAVIVLVTVAGFLFFMQKNNIQVTARDDQRKTAINAMYYNLEEVFYAKNHFYPSKIETKDLPAMDPVLFKDSNGFTINDESGLSEYSYEPTNCENDKCKSYVLRAGMENEAEYVKKSRH